MFIEAEQSKMAFLKVIITLQILGVFQKFFCILNTLLRSTGVPNFIKIQNIWCIFLFAHLAWKWPDYHESQSATLLCSSAWTMHYAIFGNLFTKKLYSGYQKSYIVVTSYQPIHAFTPRWIFYDWHMKKRRISMSTAKEWLTLRSLHSILLLSQQVPVVGWHSWECAKVNKRLG